MQIKIILLVVLASASLVVSEFKHKKSKKWSNHAKKYNLSFKNDEHQEEHFEYFDKVDQIIESQNSNPNSSFRLGHNSLSHISPKELKQLNGRKSRKFKPVKGDFDSYKYISENGVTFQLYSYTPGYKLPESFDWVQNGWKPTVKDQSPCGNCWAHSTTSAMEFQVWKKTKQNIPLSRQELTDCGFSFGNSGCDGGIEQYAFDYMIKNKINDESSYQYTSGYGGKTEKTHGTCRANTGKNKNSLTKYVLTQPGDEKALMEVLHKYGPVAIGVSGSHPSFAYYKSGILNECVKMLDHAVLLVGYGTENGKKFWNVLNSWGSSWGNNGFVKITRENDKCGIVEAASVVPLDSF